jgi:hypothetical protein
MRSIFVRVEPTVRLRTDETTVDLLMALVAFILFTLKVQLFPYAAAALMNSRKNEFSLFVSSEYKGS